MPSPILFMARRAGSGSAPRDMDHLPDRRIRHESRRMWTPAMKRSLRSLERREDGSYAAVFQSGACRLAVLFPRGYPFVPFRICVETRKVAHCVDVARALAPLCPGARAAVAGLLCDTVKVDIKEWLYRRILRHEGAAAAAEMVRACSADLPPHLWSPAMGLNHFWETVIQRIDRAQPGCAFSAR